MKLVMLTVSALALAACMDDGPRPLPGPPQACNAEPAQRFLGRPATPRLVEQVRRRSGAATARRITPEMRVTMEFRADRVNVWVGITGNAERINCG